LKENKEVEGKQHSKIMNNECSVDEENTQAWNPLSTARQFF
jgi:hypothetical protein